MVITLYSDCYGLHERRNDEHSPELQSRGSDFLSEMGQVVFIDSSDSIDQAVHSETLEYSGNLGTGRSVQYGAKETVLEPPDIKLSPDDAFEQLQILTVKEIKPTISLLSIRYGLRDFFKILDSLPRAHADN